MVMSPNAAEMGSPLSRKRSHDDCSRDDTCNSPFKTDPHNEVKMESPERGTAVVPQAQHIAIPLMAQSPPPQTSPADSTRASCSTPADGPASPNTPTRGPLLPVPSGHNIPTATQPATMPPPNTVLPTGQGPPKRRRKLTPAEKAQRDAQEAVRKAEREQKARIDEEKRKAKQAEKEALQAAREQKAAEARKAKEERRLEAEKKEREKREEAERKARAQTKIGAFFIKKDPVTPKPSLTIVAAVKARSPSPAAVRTLYAKLALPFFVHESVSMAKSPFDVDEDTKEAKTRELTEHLNGEQPSVSWRPFDPVTLLQLPSTPPRRGRSFPSVRDIMADHDGGMINPLDLIADSLSLPSKKSLKAITMKQFSFHEDVRPGYFGTVTSVQSVAALRKMARNPTAKDLPLNYDYDSEAEWVQGEEEEDEAIDDMTDDDEEEDEAKSLDGFLDDDDDVVRPTGRLMMGSMDPEISGICFEDHMQSNPDPQMYKYRMKFLIPGSQHHHSIDPFSSAYWPSSGKASTSTSPGQTIKAKSAEKAAKTKGGDNMATATMAPPPAPTPSKMNDSSSLSNPPPSATDLVPIHHLGEFKEAVMQFKYLAKTALVPTLKKRFDGCTKHQITATLELVAEKRGRNDWRLKPSS